MYRVWDKKKKRWLNENVYLTPEGDLYESYKSILGQNKLSSMSQDRYVYQKSIDLLDKNDKMIYMGDYLEAQVADDRTVTGLVTYAPELSAYVILCDETDEYFTLGESVVVYISVIGNVFEGVKEVKKDGKQAL